MNNEVVDAIRTHDPRVGETVRLLRKQLGLTQLQLAARAGVTDTTVRCVERASKTFHRSTLSALAAALGTSVEDLIVTATSSTVVDRTSDKACSSSFQDGGILPSPIMEHATLFVTWTRNGQAVCERFGMGPAPKQKISTMLADMVSELWKRGDVTRLEIERGDQLAAS